MRSRIVLVLAVAIVLGLLGALLNLSGERGGACVGTPAQAQSDDQIEPALTSDPKPPNAPGYGTGRALAPTVPLTEPVEDMSRMSIRGHVLDLLASPISGVDVRLDDGQPSTAASDQGTSDSNGEFTIEGRNREGLIRVADGPWVAVFEPRYSPKDPNVDHLLVIAPAQVIAGRVVDESNHPISGAQVEIKLNSMWGSSEDGLNWGPDNDIRAAFPLNLSGSNTAKFSVKTDTSGAFRLDRAPQIARASVSTRAQGYEQDNHALPTAGEDMLIALHVPSKKPGWVVGKVVESSGHSIEGAWVFLGSKRTTSKKDGSFVLDLGNDPHGSLLIAFEKGWMPATQPCLASSPLAPEAWPSPLVLTFRERTLEIRGQVEDPTGTPIPRARVSLLDPVRNEELLTSIGAPAGSVDLGGELDENRETVATNEAGAFLITGLLPRTYRLRAQDVRTLVSSDTGPVPAGSTSLRITIAPKNTYPCLAGLLVDRDGHPISNMRVQARQSSPTGDLPADETRTDAEGRFHMEGLSRDADSLAILPEAGMPQTYQLASFADPCNLVLVFFRLGDIRVEISNPEMKADRFEVLDAKGKRVYMAKHFESGWQGPCPSMEFEDGKSQWAIVSEAAVVIVLRSGDKELMRAPLQVRPGERTVVRM
jgi:protocatechuate 3,4-dioxygenase beta subunit